MLRKPITAALATVCLATLTIPAQAQSQAVAKSDAECRLSKNGETVYNDDCTVKEKASEGRETFVVKFDNGKIFRFSGPNRQNLRIEDDFANASNVLFEDKGAKGVFSWNDGNSTYKLVVKTGAASSGGSGGSGGDSGGGLVLGPPVPDLQYLVGKSPVSAALGFVIRGTKYVSESQVPQGTLTYMVDKKRCVAFLSSNNIYKAITLADDNKCQR
jgi:uncharacterized membrane protein